MKLYLIAHDDEDGSNRDMIIQAPRAVDAAKAYVEYAKAEEERDVELTELRAFELPAVSGATTIVHDWQQVPL